MVANALVLLLLRHGIRLCAYVPGAAIQPSVNSAVASEMRTVLCGHEGAAVSLAEGFYRRSRKLAVVGMTAGPGALSAINAVANAKIEQAAMLIVTGQVPTTFDGRGAAQEYDVVAAYRHAVKKSIELKDPSRIQDALIDLLQVAVAGRPGPVHLSLAMNQSTTSVTIADRTSVMLDPPRIVDMTHISAAAARIEQARSPVLLLGYGTKLAGAGASAALLAARCGATIVTTARAKGVVPEDGQLCRGVFGLGGTQGAMDSVTNSDLLLIIGSRCGEASTGAWDPVLASVPKIQVDIERSALGRVYDLAYGLEGHAGVVLDALSDAITIHRSNSVPRPSLIDNRPTLEARYA
jgi:acetolactate synthase-1/2/3 large subunit